MPSGQGLSVGGRLLFVFVFQDHADRGRAGVALPRLDAFAHRECGDDEGGDRVGPPPTQGAVEDEPDQHGGGQVGADQGLLGSATAVAEPTSRPARRSAYDRNGITITLSAVSRSDRAVLDVDATN